MGIPDHLTCFLRKLYAGQEATVRTDCRTHDLFKIGKGIHQGCILSPYLFNLYAEYIMRNVGPEEEQAGIKISRRATMQPNNSTFGYLSEENNTDSRRQIQESSIKF